MDQNHQPEKISSFARKEDTASSTVTVPESPGADSPKLGVGEQKTEESTYSETKEGESEKSEEKTDEVEEKPAEEAPPRPYSLEKALEDIDQFVSNFPAKNKDDNDNPLEIPAFVEKFLDLVEENIGRYDSKGDLVKSKWCQVVEEDALFIEALDRISKLNAALVEFRSDATHGSLINQAGGLQQRVMSYLEEEFRLLLEDSRNNEHDRGGGGDGSAKLKHSESDRCNLKEPESEDVDFPGYTEEVLSSLNRIAKEMISGGHESECCELYMIARREAFDECLINLEFQKISIDDVQKMQWDALETEIATWSKTFKQCATVYFQGERKLADVVFTDYPSIAGSLFSNLTRGVLIQLLNFGEAIAMSKRSAEKLFKFLDIYETLRDSLPAMNGLFEEESAKELKTETTTTRCRIGEAAISIFCDLENSIKSDTGKTPVPGGTVHPLTRYTMNYLKYACEYKDTLEQVFKEHSKIERADSSKRSQYDGGQDNETPERCPFSSQLMRVMDLLDANLEAKSKLYRDISLSSIFMMNNGRYILQKFKGSAEIYQVMGDTWCRKRSSDLRNYHKGYQRETWGKLLGCLSHEGLQVNGKVVKPVLKERFKSFNAMFDEIHRTQSCWIVIDKQLQSELRVSISAVVIPAYRSFLGRFSQHLDAGRQTEKYIKFQAEDIENAIDELFEGNPTSMARRKT
ncbi:putative Exocyst subunit exo70 family protein C2 [Tripterygium wilfordii]|uniref:Exocyst subunit Exo70 family protein n=1 Tax=Tripterygium wilfordii TaxID=458696 RepID=A0A7J7BU67_TRIWF|nr:exocyst complex component EXO70B1-like [Tripterygium wilfordii]KAF5725434.1 putative Exocyst subunit exo70 family protein C2 [Tripterygium wilfordii]